MALKIKNIPELKGKDARRFEKEIEANKDKYVSEEEYQKGIELCRIFQL